MDKPTAAADHSLHWPVDADEERQRLLDDAGRLGVDPEPWLALAREIATLHHPSPEDYRAVDRHLVAGFTLEAAREELVDHDVPEQPRSVKPDMVHGPDEGPVTL